MQLTGVLGATNFDRTRLRRKVLIGLQRSLYFSGVTGLYERFTDRGGFLALMYHSVLDSARIPFIDPSNAIPADVFEEQLVLLKETCNVISLEQAIEYHRGARALPENAVVITFDDGYLDNFEVAAPLLAKYKLPATLFVCTGYVDRQEPQWIDELYTAFQFGRARQLVLPQYPIPFALDHARGVLDAYQFVSAQLLTLGYAERRALLDTVKAQLDPSREAPRLTLSWDDLRAMRREYPDFTLGVHTHDHIDLSGLPVAHAVAEIRKSQRLFQSELGYAARYLTYPYGRISHPLVDRLPDLGIEAAFITQPTDRVTRNTGVYAMPRFEVTESLVDLRMWGGGALPELGRQIFGRVADQV
ncbi:MAG: polysaccharide deacetylase family protein [Thiotrichales bacterium]